MEAGQIIAGRYRLDTPIGEGAMAAVWRAEDETLKRQVAIKFLFVKGTRDPDAMVDQFLREARIAASVQHRNVIHTQDFGTVDGVQPFMVMELLSGESLGDRMEREPKLSDQQFIQLLSLTLRGLAAVHDAGIVHRDLKPHNIFLQRDSDAIYPKILDFGISRSLEQGEDRPSAIQTQEGLIVGTPDYMSPEQARGEPNIDRRADIYAMGVILYEGLSGRLPFEAQNIGDLIVQIVTAEPPPLSEVAPHVSAALSEMVARAMSKEREGRFPDARAMRSALLSAAEPGRAKPAASPPVATVASPAATPPARTGGGSSTWGDFEGLSSAAAAPGPVVPEAPPPAKRPPGPAAPPAARAAPAAAPAAELSLDLDLATPHPRGGRRGGGGRSGRTKQGAMQETGALRDLGGGDDPFDPLSPGLSPAAGPVLSLDLATDVRSPAARPKQPVRTRPGMRQTRRRSGFSLWHGALVVSVLVFLGAVGYAWLQPTPAPLADEPPPSGDYRPLVEQRRSGLDKLPPHMRDVQF